MRWPGFWGNLSRMNKLSVVMLCSILAGCGGSSADTAPAEDTGVAGGDTAAADTGSTPDGTADSTTPTDTSGTDTGTPPADTPPPSDGGIKCGTLTCTGGDVCCVGAAGGGGGPTYSCAKTCADGGVALACTSPADCGGGTPICCGAAEITGSGFSCGFKGGASSCKAECKSSLPLTGCPGTATVRLCAKKADCTEAGYDSCCTISGGGTTTTACISATIAGLLKAPCL